jgi:hypothetical protein
MRGCNHAALPPVDLWTVIRFTHIVALAFFVGGQLVLVAAVVPALRDGAAMPAVARRFGMGSGVALAALVATGVAMAEHASRWSDTTLHVKLALIVLIGVLLGLHVVAPRSRALSAAVLLASLAVVWLGVELAHGY